MKKTKMVIMVIGLITLGFTALNCGSGNNNNPTTPYATPFGTSNNGYAMNSSGQCIMTTTGQIAPSQSYCTSAYGTTGYGTTGYGTTGYGTTGYGTSGYGTGSICYGPYIWNGQEGMCMGQPDNCRGYLLTSVQTGQQVYCQ